MSPKTLRTVIAVLLFVHAIGHGQGIVASLGIFKIENWNVHSWLFDGLLGEKGSRILAFTLFAVCMLGFLATAFAFLESACRTNPGAYWQSSLLSRPYSA